MDAGKFMLLSIDDVELDRSNPRIRRFLEMYEGEPTYEHIALALDVTSGTPDDQDAGTTPEKLKNSILASGGIMQPIIVRKVREGGHLCIEGNTRLYLYRTFARDKIPAWSTHPTAGDPRGVPEAGWHRRRSGKARRVQERGCGSSRRHVNFGAVKPFCHPYNVAGAG